MTTLGAKRRAPPGLEMTESMTSRTCIRASGLEEGLPEDLRRQALGLYIQLQGGDASRVPATLKSMSPLWSSNPWISVRIQYSLGDS